MSIQFKNGSTAYEAALRDFLTQSRLPTGDLPADLSGFTLAIDDHKIVGSAGMELMGKLGLLRSVAVAESHRNHKLGQRLFSQALEYARNHQVDEVYLITNTAEHYFLKNGFLPVERNSVPNAIAQTAQFTGLCPSSSVVMKITLN